MSAFDGKVLGANTCCNKCSREKGYTHHRNGTHSKAVIFCYGCNVRRDFCHFKVILVVTLRHKVVDLDTVRKIPMTVADIQFQVGSEQSSDYKLLREVNLDTRFAISRGSPGAISKRERALSF